MALSAQKRKKIEALRDREAKQDRRAKLEELLVVKLCNKYGRNTEMCGKIATVVSYFMKTRSKIAERDLVTLENKVRSLTASPTAAAGSMMMSSSRPSSRGGSRPGSRGGSRPVSRGGDGSMSMSMSSSMGGMGNSSMGNSTTMNMTNTMTGSSPLATESAQTKSMNGLKALGLNVTGKLDKRAEQEGEWMVLATFNKLQYEKEDRERSVKLHAARSQTKLALDGQMQEHYAKIEKERQAKTEYAAQQKVELKQWEVREKEKFDKRLAQAAEEDVFRQAQVDERARFIKSAKNTKMREDTIEIEKCRQMIQAEKLQLVKQKERERAKLESIMVENEVRRKKMATVLEKEAAEDIALMHAYAAKLEKQDKDRAEAFQATIRRSQTFVGAAEKIKEKEDAKEAELEANIERYHQTKIEADALRERREKAKRANDVVERKRTLAAQVAAMKVVEDREREVERAFASQFEADRVAAEQEEAAKQRKIREQNIRNQQLLREQMAAACIVENHPDFPGMSKYEAAMNRRIIGTILKDPESKRQIELAMSSSTPADADVSHDDSSSFDRAF